LWGKPDGGGARFGKQKQWICCIGHGHGVKKASR
jgi:hypothetical protein